MDKVLVTVRISAIEKMYDIWVPLEGTIGEVKILIGVAVERLSNDRYCADSRAVLCSMETGMYYREEQTVKQSGIINGAALMLI